MDISIGNQTPQAAVVGTGVAKGSGMPKPRSQVDNSYVEVSAVDRAQSKAIQDERLKAVAQAIKAAQSMYAVSDTKFTIFKDVSGEYITRVVSLRDGSTSYYPEPQATKKLQSMGVDTSGIPVKA